MMTRSEWAVALIGILTSAAGCGDAAEQRDAPLAEVVDTTDASEVEPADSDEPSGTVEVDDAVEPDATDDARASDADAAEPGAIAVGYRTSSLTYTPPDGSGPRTLRLVAWYPTRASEGAEVRYLNLLPATGVLGDAPPASDLGPRPVVVFSHGNSSFAEQSFFFTEALARAGYLVVAPDHTSNTFGATPDVRIFHWRPEDISAVLDHVERLASLDASDPLAALAPLVSDHVALAGHSFGGYTTLAVGGAAWDVDLLTTYCETEDIPLDGCTSLAAHDSLYRGGFLDARVDALVPMSPGAVLVFGPAGVAAVAVPTLLVTGARDATTPNDSDGDPAWAQLAGSPDNRRIDFADGGHFTFSDACALPVSIGENDGCGDDFIAPERAHAAVNAYALAFLARHLAADESGAALLDGDEVIEPGLTLSIGGGP